MYQEGSTRSVSGSASAKTGRVPSKTAAFAVAMKVIAGTITSSPRPIPCDAIAACRAAVPLQTATASRLPVQVVIASSN